MGDLIKIAGGFVLVWAASYVWQHPSYVWEQLGILMSIKLTDFFWLYLIGDVFLIMVVSFLVNILRDAMEPFDSPPMIVIGPILVMFLLWIFCIVMTFLIVPRYVYENSDKIAAAMTPRVVILPAIGLSVFLYWLRGRLPLIYGSLEIFVGMFSLSIATQGLVTDLLTKLIGVFGGIYIMIRGLDNANKGIPGGFAAVWSKVFKKQTQGVTPDSKDD